MRDDEIVVIHRNEEERVPRSAIFLHFFVFKHINIPTSVIEEQASFSIRIQKIIIPNTKVIMIPNSEHYTEQVATLQDCFPEELEWVHAARSLPRILRGK